MNYSELNEYIKRYLENDKTGRALMLTAPWGTGKSYFVKNTLVNYLKTKDQNGKEINRCIIVSLYGLKELKDISKNIYFEVRAKFLNKKSEKISTGKIIAKSVVKGIAGYFGVDLNISEEDLQKLYESIDLTGKLLIFEDVERSGIDLLEFMGYLNNLVEQDGVKVLLVVNEKELIKFEKNYNEEINDDTELDEDLISSLQNVTEINNKRYTEQTETYLRIKEKTISDTIIFECDFPSAIKDILLDYSELLSEYTQDDLLNELSRLLKLSGNANLRSFIFACQKTVDIFHRGEDLINEQSSKFKKSIFYGIILYSLKIKSGKMDNWDGDRNLSLTMGNEKYPLYRFCFDYIQYQIFDETKINSAAEAFNKILLYDTHKSVNDNDLIVLYSSVYKPENIVRRAIANIEKRLKSEDDIAFIEYGRIANYLVNISSIIDIDISNCKKLLIKNLEGKCKNIDEYLLFLGTIKISDENKNYEYLNLKQDMLNSLRKTQNNSIYFTHYTSDELDKFFDNRYENIEAILNNRTFLKDLDIDRFTILLTKCSAEQIYHASIVFGDVIYQSENLKLLTTDEPFIELFKATINKKLALAVAKKEIDKIQYYQIKSFISVLINIKMAFKG